MAAQAICETCGRTQLISPCGVVRGLDERELASIGWSQTERGRLCPFCSDRGTPGLDAVFFGKRDRRQASNRRDS